MSHCQFCGTTLPAGHNACPGSRCWQMIKAGAPALFDVNTGQRLGGPGVSVTPQNNVAPLENGLKTETAVAQKTNFSVWFVVPGKIQAKPRMTSADRGMKPRPPVQRYKEWKAACVASAIQAFGGLVPDTDQVVAVSWLAVIVPPKQRQRNGHPLVRFTSAEREALCGTKAWSKPDRDNIDKSLLDALWPDDDSGVCAGTINKVFGMVPRLEVTIELEG